MVEVDVDIGRLLALTRHETLEEQFMLDRVDRSDAQEEADAAVRGAPAPLTQDAAAPAFGDDRVHGQEIGRIAKLANQPQLMIDLLAIRSEEHTSELQSLMRISYAVFCLKKKKTKQTSITQMLH